MSFMHKACEWIANHLPNFGEHTICGPDGTKYLRRIYLTPRRKDSNKPWWPGIFLHHFYQSDAARSAPHSHPWKSSLSLILAGGYLEHRYWSRFGTWTHIKYVPGSVNRLNQDTYHWVELLHENEGAWSLFCAFETVSDWGFWNIDESKFIPWQEYLGTNADGLEKD